MSDNTFIPDTKVPDTQEFFEHQSQTNALNAKRTFDEFQDVSLTAARRSQVNYDHLNHLALQALQNAVTTADMVAKNSINNNELLAKQAVRNGDFAQDTYWNPVTQGAANTLTSAAYTPNRTVDVAAGGVATANEAVAAAVAQQVNATLAPIIGTITAMVEALSVLAAKISATPTSSGTGA